MSLRTRRSSALLASLMLLAVACTSTPGQPTTAPQTSAPQTTAPETTAPETNAPETGAPETTAPETTAPETTAPETTAPSTGGTLRVYCCATDPRSLRPQAASGSDEISILSATQRGLLYYDPEGNIVPVLATDMPTLSDDGLTYTFTLGDHQYSDGTPIVAEDFVRAARSLADPRNAFDYGYEACWIAGVDAVLGTDFGCSEGDTPYLDAEAGTFDDATIDGLLEQIGVTAPDEHTVVFTLKTPASFFLNIAAMWLFTPVHPEQTSWAEAADLKASGPYMVTTWSHNAQIVLEKNPNWTGTAPSVDRIEHNIGGDPVAALAAWERGDLDIISVPSTEVRRVLDTPDFADKINRGTTLSLEYYDFANCPDADTCPPNAAVADPARLPGQSPSQNINCRKALTQAIDRAELIQVGFAGLGSVAYTPTMPGLPGFPTVTDADNPLPFDVAAALTTMATALDELGVGQPDPATVLPADDTCDDACQLTKARVKLLAPLKFGYNCDANHDQRVLYLANAWRTNLGFSGQQMDIRCTDFGTFRTERRAGNVYDIARNGWGADFPHPDNQNRDLFACGAGNNNSKYCNPDYDALLSAGAAAATYDESLQSYHDAEMQLVEDAPVLFLRYGESVRLV
ncbi:MAG TPA: ABC transporter substrate-binding protein, partial [Actinomycetes bacterium]|nr:ABC transporter substrate-binding protein [Actinomycetes bacterium]